MNEKPSIKALMNAPRCNRTVFMAAAEGIILDRDASGKVIIGEAAFPYVERAAQGEIVVLTENNKPVSYIMGYQEYEIKEEKDE